MRPLQTLLDWLRWKLFDFLQWQFPPEQPTEEEYIAYLKDKERHSLPELPIIEAVPQHTGPITPVAQPILGIRQRAHLRAASGQLFTSPIRRIDLIHDDGWLNSRPISISDVDTRKVTPEETEKYRALPKFLQ